MELLGIHHVSAITANVKKNYNFYTNVLGLRLVKKTVNQDDPTEYHLFYGDETGQPGTSLTFFERKDANETEKGTNCISGTSFRVPNDVALTYWEKRFVEYHVDHDPITEIAGRKTVFFRDPEGQRLALVSNKNDAGVEGGIPWKRSPVPVEYGIIGLGPSKITVANPEQTLMILCDVLSFEQIGSYPAAENKDILILSTGDGGLGAEIHLEVKDELLEENPGFGSVHHIAFRVGDYEALRKWRDLLERVRMPNSGLVDHHYFHSIYLRDPNGIMFQLATDEPGFTVDEEIDHLGESLSLPPSLKRKREEIESALTPLNTEKAH